MAAADNPMPNPYVGPRPFERRADDQARFFGRERETEEIVSLVFSHPLVLVYAQSGAGKTSLFNARIAPTLEKRGFQVLPLTRVLGAVPEEIDPDSVANLYLFNALMNLDPEGQPATLSGQTLSSFLQGRSRQQDRRGRPMPRVLIFDQFEEFFTLYPPNWRQQQDGFFDQVADALAADPLLRVVLVLREDYLAQLDPFAHRLPEELRIRFRLERLRRQPALAAVQGPLAGTGRTFAEGAAETLVEELLKIRVTEPAGKPVERKGEFVEPVQLQVVCQSLWEELPPAVTVISESQLLAFGDVNQALSDFFARSVSAASRDTRVSESKLRGWFEEQLITPAGTRGTVYRGSQRTGGISNNVVDVLENQHIIRGEWRAGARWYELTHDRFIGPIESANQTWRTRRRERWLRAAATVASALILIPLFTVTLLLFGRSNWPGSPPQATAIVRDATATASAYELAQARATATVAAAISDRLSRVRPLKPGYSVSGTSTTAGTIGAFARDSSGNTYLLTTQDVLGTLGQEPGSPVIQPGRVDGGDTRRDVVAVTAILPLIADGVPVAHMIGAARLEPDIGFETTIPGLGPLRGVREPEVGLPVHMLGRTSGVVSGEILSVGQTRRIFGIGDSGGALELTNAILTTPMSAGGDGGALVVDEEGYAIGFVVAGGTGQTILAPVQEVLETLDLELLHTGQ